MKPLPDTDLTQLVNNATAQMLHERTQDVESAVRNVLRRQEIIAEDVVKYRTELKKRETKLEFLSARIARLRAGEWQVLAELKEEAKSEQGTEIEKKP